MRNSYDSRTSEGSFAQEQSNVITKNRAAFIAKTYQLFGASLLAGAAGAYVGLDIAATIAQYQWFIFIPWVLFAMFGMRMVADKPGINLIALFIFAFVGGLVIAPMLSMYVQMGKTNIIANAFASTAVLFGGLSVYAMKTKTDFSSWGKPLVVAFILTFVISLVNAFIFKSPILFIGLQAVWLMVISGLVLFDTQNIIRGLYRTPVEAALSLYINFFNMFITLLQIFGFMGGDD
ncbi:MAG: Arginine/ornithine antiporter ArcD [uncultured Campylobacterales bacterium]|uniref:Arginine/ornithine antiporter ArcD n=1 Tax=uncultured Campylobacterales bacterium TaxID=352960 RepID=A0A6S6SHB9_9BACT|nr:MAG: Arginine/ornithine antiporter ArcD [uncultured Campylobacterales bacterium]